MDIAHKIENVKVDRRGRCIDDVVVKFCNIILIYDIIVSDIIEE